MNMQFLADRPTDKHRDPDNAWTIYQANISSGGGPRDLHASGAPVVAVKHKGVFYPRVPELEETYGSVTALSLRELENTWNFRETKFSYDESVNLAVNYGIHSYYDLLKDTTRPSAEDMARNPFGGFPESAFHEGVTLRLLKRRHAGLLAAMVKLGLLADDSFTNGHRRTAQDDAAAALDSVDRMWRQAFAKREPLPPGTLRWFIDAQLWWPPHIYTGSAGVIDAKPTPKLLPKPKSEPRAVLDWS